MSFRIEGVDSVKDGFKKLGVDTPKKAESEVLETLEKAANTAKSLGTSLWQKRPQVSVPTIDAVHLEAGRGYLEVSSPGGFFQEIGTSKMPPKPALGPAMDAHEEDFIKALERIAGEDL